jgi:DNA polymerase III subunit epsilon
MPLSAWLDRLTAAPRWDDTVLWALDLETSGLRPETDRILSVGMVPIRRGAIRLGERFESLVRPADLAALSTEGLRAHHLLPEDVADGPPLDVVLPDVDRRVREGLLLVHFAALDLAFLRRAYRRVGLPWPRPRVVDTVDLILALHDREQQWTPHPPEPVTGLAAARARLGLPPYRRHEALADALATAELFLALRSRLKLATLRSSVRVFR